MLTALLAIILVTFFHSISVNPAAGLTLASLTPQLQQSTQAAIPPIIDAGVPHRSLVVEQDFSDVASSSSESAVGADVQHEQCTNGSSITLDNLTSCIDGYHSQNGPIFDFDFQSEILQPIHTTNSVLHHPQLTSIKDQFTVLRFLVCWFGVGTLCYVVGNSFPSSFAAKSLKRCSAVVETTSDHVVAGPSRLQQLNAWLIKEWRDKWKPILLRMRDLCVSALKFVVASILWFCNLCGEFWQVRQKVLPAEIFLIKTPAFSSFALHFAMAFFRLNHMHAWKARTPINCLRICNDFLLRHQSQNLDIRHLLMSTKTQNINSCNVYPSQALREYNQQDKGSLPLCRLPNPTSSAATKKPLAHVLDPEAFVFALEQALRIPKYRKLAVRLMKPYMKNDCVKLEQLSLQIKAQGRSFSKEKDQINLYWQDKIYTEEHKANAAIQELEHYRLNSQNKVAKMTTDHKRTLNQERDKVRSAEEKVARVEEEKTKMALELRRRDLTISKQQKERERSMANRNFDLGIMEIKLETCRGKVNELQAEARIKDQANTASLERITELEAEVRIKDEASSLLENRLDRSQQSETMKDTEIAKLTTTVEELEQERNELKEANRLSRVAESQTQQFKGMEESKPQASTAVDLDFWSKDCNPALDAETSMTEGSTAAATPGAGAPISPPDGLVSHGSGISQSAVKKSPESWDDDFSNSSFALTAPVPLILDSLPESRTIADMLDILFPSENSEPALSIGSQFSELSSETSIAEKTWSGNSSDTTETLSYLSGPMTEASNQGLLVDTTFCTSSDLDELSGKDTEDLLQLSMPESFSSWSQSIFDVFAPENPMDAFPVVILPNAGRFADLTKSQERTAAQVEPPAVSSTKIFNMDTGVISVGVPSSTIHQERQAKEIKHQEGTALPIQAKLRPSHKKYHYRNRGGRPVGSSGLHSSLAISRASLGP